MLYTFDGTICLPSLCTWRDIPIIYTGRVREIHEGIGRQPSYQHRPVTGNPNPSKVDQIHSYLTEPIELTSNRLAFHF